MRALSASEAINMDGDAQHKITSFRLDDASIIRRSATVEHERSAALADLLHDNYFAPLGLDTGPYDVFLSARDNRLRFEIRAAHASEMLEIILPLAPFRSVIKDYFLICENYFDIVKTGDPYRIEAIDMGRRSIHNEGSELLKTLLEDKITVDFNTARRLFTLICVLHIK